MVVPRETQHSAGQELVAVRLRSDHMPPGGVNTDRLRDKWRRFFEKEWLDAEAWWLLLGPELPERWPAPLPSLFFWSHRFLRRSRTFRSPLGRMMTPVTPSSSEPAPSDSPPKLVMNLMVPAPGGVGERDLEWEEDLREQQF
ncbi:hypothetical protein E2C01_048927 [Portunus trituberculatus]|uniref:Uncharacterized protein n=1 Tax=Portunus trituberculatus TaxID=210409 RepID=A0A5B7GBU3_PORTR|nr:hypothetical protein [Portunus trituberculatus]